MRRKLIRFLVPVPPRVAPWRATRKDGKTKRENTEGQAKKRDKPTIHDPLERVTKREVA